MKYVSQTTVNNILKNSDTKQILINLLSEYKLKNNGNKNIKCS